MADWTAIAVGVEAVGTLGVFSIAVGTLYQDHKQKRLERSDERARAARLVSVWTEDFRYARDGDLAHVTAVVANQNTTPILQVSFAPDGPWRMYHVAESLEPGTHRFPTGATPTTHQPTEAPTVWVVFRDTKGIRWATRTGGALVELNDRADFYGSEMLEKLLEQRH